MGALAWGRERERRQGLGETRGKRKEGNLAWGSERRRYWPGRERKPKREGLTWGRKKGKEEGLAREKVLVGQSTGLLPTCCLPLV